MKREYITHIAKSNMSYSVDAHTLHLRLKTNKGTTKKIEVIYGDPFRWEPVENEKNHAWYEEKTNDNLMTLEFSSTIYDYWFIEIKSETKRVKYAFVIDDRYLFGCRDLYDVTKYPNERTNLFNYFNYPYILDVDSYKAPSWVDGTVWYSIFPDRFCNKDNTYPKLVEWESVTDYNNHMYFGGNLKGITSKLPYLKSFGISGLYLNPIFTSPTAHKYDIVDYFEIDELFGTKQDLKELVEKAHSLGIKVMLDAVYNHCSIKHPFFQDVIKNEENSIYKDCFYIKKFPVINFELQPNGMPKRGPKPKEGLNYETFAFSKGMPKMNTEHPLMRKHLIDAGKYWIEEFDIDGWRLDVANEVSHDFWRVFQQEMRNVKPDVFILGENWDNSMPWLNGDQHDAVMNYEFMFPIWSYFGKTIKTKQYTGEQLVSSINDVLFNYPKPTITKMFNIIDSHDTTRILTICNDDVELTKIVYLFQFSLPGTPSIYYGGEIGLAGEHDPDNRRCMIWDETRQNKDMLQHIKKLSTLYVTEKSFVSPTLKWLEYSDHHLVYQKEDLYFLLNKGEHDIEITSIASGQYVDIYNNEIISIDSSITLNAKSFLILKKNITNK